jgi:ABC-type antimicrobial peptide transport system permease subunit
VVYERTLSSGRSFEIVGVTADHKLQTVGEPPLAAIYFSTTQRPTSYNVVMVRTAGDDTRMLARMREILAGLAPDLLLIDSQTMRAQIAATLFPARVAATLVSIFSVLGLLLAAIGLYGVIAFSVARRTRDIGLRMAVGARPSDVLGMVMRQGLALTLAGTSVGFALAAAATRVVAGALYGIGAADPAAWSAAALVLLLIAGLANFLPARRAMRISPAIALRTE